MAETTTAWTVLSLLLWAADYLEQRGFDEARLTADLLLAHVLGLRRMDLYLQYDRPLSADELAAFKTAFKRRLSHEPLQYITGETVFMGHRLELTAAVLIPRPETEVLVETCIDAVRTIDAPRILDAGTGSGNIALALAAALPGAQVLAVDVSPEALEVAARNAGRIVPGRVELRRHDLFADPSALGRFDLVVSNPPYVTREEYASLQVEIREFEPARAVTDGDDGLRFLRRLLELAPAILDPGGVLCVELNAEKAGEALAMARAAGCADAEVITDLSRLPRVLRCGRGGRR